MTPKPEDSFPTIHCLLPETVAFFAVANTTDLTLVKNVCGEDFGESNLTTKIVIPRLKGGAENLLSLTNKKTEKWHSGLSESTYDVTTGIRHFMPVNIAMGAPWAAYFLNFEEAPYGKNLTGISLSVYNIR